MSEFSRDGLTILRNGEPLTTEQILIGLNRAEAVARSGRKKLDAFINLNNMCWKAKARGEKEIYINEILDVIERYCD